MDRGFGLWRRRASRAMSPDVFWRLPRIYDGAPRGDAARIGGVGLQTVHDWVLRFNAKGLDGLKDGKAPGQTPKLNEAQRRALVAMVEAGPIPAIHGVVRWRSDRSRAVGL